MGEFTFTKPHLKNHKVFSATKLTRSDITFLQDNQYVVLRLKRSKTDVKHTGVEIIIAATNDTTCPVLALRQLFMLGPQPSNALLFKLDNEVAFARKPVIQIFVKNSKQAASHARPIPATVFAKVQLSMLPTTVC